MGILQARILEWDAMPSSRGSPQPRDRTQVSRITGRFFTNWAIREALSCVSVQFISVQSLSRVWLFATPWIAACQTSLSIMCIAIPKWLTVMAERKTILLKFLASLWKDSFAHKSLSWGGVILKIFIYLYRWASTSHSGASINKNSHRSVSTAMLIHGEQIPLLQQKLYHISVACYAASYAPAQLVLCLLLLWVLV